MRSDIYMVGQDRCSLRPKTKEKEAALGITENNILQTLDLCWSPPPAETDPAT